MLFNMQKLYVRFFSRSENYNVKPIVCDMCILFEKHYTMQTLGNIIISQSNPVMMTTKKITDNGGKHSIFF